MSTITMDKKEELIMKLVHYLVTVENYKPIVVTGVENEIWLENIDAPYRIVRINSNYIRNDVQYNTDLYRAKSVIKQIKRKTLSFTMKTLNIFTNIDNKIVLDNDNGMTSIYLNKASDITKNETINGAFPEIQDKLIKDTKGIDLIINVTNDISLKTAKENQKYENVFKPKKIIITSIIIAICIIMYILTSLKPELFYLFANNKDLVRGGQFFRIITAPFLHAGIIHLLMNMYSLYILGNQLESFIGKAKFLFIYLVSAVAGSLFSIIFTNSFSVGASGAIFGIMGSLLYFGYHYRLYLSGAIKSQIIPLILINLVISFMIPNIDISAHIGGLVGGFLATMAVGIDEKDTKVNKFNGWLVLALFFAFIIYMGLFFK